MDSGVLFHTSYVPITTSQLHEKGMLIVIHFNPSRSFFYMLRSFVSGIVKKRALNQSKNTNIIAYKNARNCPYSQILVPPKSGALGLSLFSLMVNPRLLPAPTPLNVALSHARAFRC